jgi:hypothetical protein
VYSQDVVFREVGGKSKPEEIVQTKNNLKMVRFELRNEEDDSDESIELEEEVEQHTPVVRRSERVRKPIKRYSLPDFRFAFVLTTINDEPKSVDEAINSTEGKL